MSKIAINDIIHIDGKGVDGNYEGSARVTSMTWGGAWVQARTLESWDGEEGSIIEVPAERCSPAELTDHTLSVLAAIVKEREEKMLDFETGATRNRKENELQYEGFLSPLALQIFGEYMHENRHTADGGVRDSDNWQKGIPDESYRDSLLRHVIDIWLIYRGWGEKAREGGDKRKALAGAFFNLQGLMHNLALEEMAE